MVVGEKMVGCMKDIEPCGFKFDEFFGGQSLWVRDDGTAIRIADSSISNG